MNSVTTSSAHLIVASSISALLLQGACSGGENDNNAPGAISGVVLGSTLPSAADVWVGWQVSSGSPDYIYLFGSGEFSGEGFSVSLDGDPPPEAINSYGIGVGFIALIDPVASLTSGVLADEDDEHILGLSSQHALIWIGEGAAVVDWAEAFPDGLSCGVCFPAKEGETFDSFAPIACDELSVSTPVDGVCNWT